MILKIYNDVELLIDPEDAERLIKVLYKNSHWVMAKNGQVSGWCKTNLGGKRKFLLGRVIMNCYSGALDVDHKNHNQFDFRKSELRVCTHQENCFNTKRKDIKIMGATEDKYGRWVSKIRTKFGRLHLGTFKTKEEAQEAYRLAVIKYHGDFVHKDKL